MPHEQLTGTAPLTTAMRMRAAAKLNPVRAMPARAKRVRSGGNETLLLVLVAGLLAIAIVVARSGRFTAGSELGYWIGVAGGVAMLMLFLYPLRKRWRPLREIGTTRFWFAFHMMLGIVGPLLIVVHSTLTFGSLNAIVAFSAMTLVAGSGIVGRFLYSRIHHGLYGRRATLADLRAQAGLDSAEVRSKLAFAPAVEAELDEFARRATATGQDGLAHPLRFMALGWHAKVARRRCTREALRALRECAAAEGWSEKRLARRVKSRRALIKTHLRLVQRVAQFGVFERLFSWWHVLHVPLVYMMVLAAVAHVIAVHMY
jgi:hypothetical protein